MIEKLKNCKNGGQISVLALLFLAVILITTLVILSSLTFFQYNSSKAFFSEKAYSIAEAGINKAIYQLNQTAGSYYGETDTTFGEGTFTVTVMDLGSNNKLVTSVGYIPNRTNPKSTKTVSIQTNPSSQNVQFRYGVQVGYGGLVMTGSSGIIGNVYSDGSIDGTGTVSITGDAWVAGGTALTADQQNIIQTQDQIVGQNSANSDAAQSFVPSQTNLINKVSLYIKKTGNPSPPSIKIMADNGGSPSKTVLAQQNLDTTKVTGSYGWVDTAFSTPPQVMSGQKYWILIDASVSSSKYFTLGVSNDSSYLLGTGELSSNWNASPPVWISLNKDFTFKTFLGGQTTHIACLSYQCLTVGVDAHANTLTYISVGRDAYYQTKTNTSVGRTSYPGTPDPGAIEMPISESNIADFESEAEAGGTQVGDYSLSGVQTASLGPKKIQGNLTLGNSAHLTLTGAVYVTGDVNLSGAAKVDLDSGYGSKSGVLITDGKVSIGNSVIMSGSGNPVSYLLVLSTNPSQDQSSPAITISGAATNTILYASQGMLYLQGSANLHEAVAQKLYLEGATQVHYDSGLANVNFSSGPGASYVVIPGTYKTN